VRVLSSGHGRKNDDADALSVGIAALTSPALGTAEIDAATTALRAVVEHRDDLVKKTRTQTVNRLHVVLTRLVAAGARRHLSADHAAELLRGVRSRDAAAKTLRALAMDLVGEVRQLDRRIAKAANDIQMAVSASGVRTLASMGELDVWYTHTTVDDALELGTRPDLPLSHERLEH